MSPGLPIPALRLIVVPIATIIRPVCVDLFEAGCLFFPVWFGLELVVTFILVHSIVVQIRTVFMHP